ncbi:MAG: adenosine deaminase [Mycobacteriales bacterium]
MPSAPSASALPVAPAALRAAPKVLLHDHLDGGLRPTTLVQLAAEYGVALPTTAPDELAAHIQRGAASGSLMQYLEPFSYTVAVLQTQEALVQVAAECVVDLAADGVVYAEIRFAPELSTAGGLDLADVVDAVLEGLQRGMSQAQSNGHRIQARALLCAMRQESRSREIAELTRMYHQAGTGVVGFDIAGPETGFPPGDHAASFALLREAGVPFTVHAGEAAGLDSIVGALDVGAHRLGHGVHLAADLTVSDHTVSLGPVARRVVEESAALELCPKSNVDTCAVRSLAEHPFVALERVGVPVTVNTDNRLMSGTSMTEEFARLAGQFGYDLAGLERLTKTAMDAAFVPGPLRRSITAEQIVPGYAAAQGL